MALVARKPSLKRTTSSRDLTRTFKKPRQLPLVMTKTPELKSYDMQASTTISQDVGSVFYCLNSMSQGDTSSQREGRSIRMKSIRIRGWVQNYEMAFATPQSVPSQMARFILFIDKSPNETNFNRDELLSSISSDYVLAPKNLSYERRFTILVDRMIPIPAATYGTTTGYTGLPQIIPYEIYHEFKDLTKSTFVGSSGSGDTIYSTENALGWFLVSTNPTALSHSLTDWRSRLRYYDF